jgi:hypothetical protein
MDRAKKEGVLGPSAGDERGVSKEAEQADSQRTSSSPPSPALLLRTLEGLHSEQW